MAVGDISLHGSARIPTGLTERYLIQSMQVNKDVSSAINLLLDGALLEGIVSNSNPPSGRDERRFIIGTPNEAIPNVTQSTLVHTSEISAATQYIELPDGYKLACGIWSSSNSGLEITYTPTENLLLLAVASNGAEIQIGNYTLSADKLKHGGYLLTPQSPVKFRRPNTSIRPLVYLAMQDLS